MRIKEDLVYDKVSGQIIGFCNLGSINDDLLTCENDEDCDHRPIANHILAVMVRGLFFKFEFPLAHFATKSVTADTLYPIVWEGIRLIESCGLKVIAVTADGASPNRKFFKMHGNAKDGLIFKTKNIYATDERYAYFFSDFPHLIKTARNCFSHSSMGKSSRCMWNNGKYILWSHLLNLYDKVSATAIASNGLSLLPKSKKEHTSLTSYSRMRVDLAAQVLSKSVAEAFVYYGDPAMEETEKFVRHFDDFFDCVNVRSFSEWKTHLKPNRKPYSSPDDPRFQWLERDFLGYLDNWQASVAARPGFSRAQKQGMTLSAETIEGLRISVHSFVALTKYLLTVHSEENLSLLSERFSQDPVENYFGQQRARGGRSDNPTVQRSLSNACALRIQKSEAMQAVRGNCSRKRRLFKDLDEITITSESEPLPKKKRR